jgi:hypothetical protein
LYYQQYVELGIYYQQVKRYLDAFGPEQVKIFIHDDLNDKMENMILSVLDFLGLDKHTSRLWKAVLIRTLFLEILFSENFIRRKKLRALAKKLVPPEKVEAVKSIFLTRDKKEDKNIAIVEELKRIYTPDIKQLEKLLNRNLSSWYE